jgi:hypothetical protein
LLELWEDDLKTNRTLSDLKNDISKILNDPKLVASNSVKKYWKYEIEKKTWHSKIQLLTTIFNIILKGEGLGLMGKQRYL